MKKIKIIFLLVFLTTTPQVYAVQLETQSKQQNSLQEVMLDVQNMTCAMCPITIKKALKNVTGVQQVNVDFDSKTAAVSFDPQKTNIDALIKATTNVGYPSSVHQEK